MASWFYYFTQPYKLEEDFDKLTDSDKLKLLREFLYESDQCDKKMESSKKLNIDLTNNNNTASPSIPIMVSPIGSPLHNEIHNNFPMDFGKDNYIQQLKKSYILYILALKCFANLRFNINIIHTWGLPLCLVGNLLRTFIRFTTGIPTVNPEHDVDWPGWSGVSRFAQVIYHFWTLLEGLDRVLIKSHKRCLTPPLPGLTEVPDIVFINENNIEEGEIVSRLEQSAQILAIMLERDDLLFEVPSSQSFKIPDLESDGLENLNFEDRTQLSPESINSNIMFFLGRHYFQRKDFERALNFFKNSKSCINSTFNHLYFVGLTPKLLDSYISLCIKLSRNNSSRFRSSYQFIEDQLLSKDWNIDKLTDILMNDLFRRFDCNVVHILNSTISNKDICPLTLSIREQLEKELKTFCQNSSDKILFFKVSVCNLLERVISGHAILTNFISDLTETIDFNQIKEVLKYLNQQTIICLEFFHNIKNENSATNGELKRSSSCPNIFCEEILSKNDFNLELQNIKCFVSFLLQTLPTEFGFSTTVYQGDTMNYFTNEEIEEIKSFMNEVEISLDDLDIYDLDDVDCDWFSMHERKSLCGDNDSDKSFNLASNINPNEVDTLRLLTSYDSEEVKDILLRLQGSGVANRNTIVNISENWKLPSVILDEMKNIKNEFEYVYDYTILCKANVLRDLKSWDLARFLYDTIKNSTVNHKFKKLINNEIICNDIQKCLFTYQDLNPNKFNDDEHADLDKRVKTCLTSARIDSDSWIADNLMISCCCFCLTVKDYEYLLSTPIAVSTTLELSSLLITVYKDFEKLNPTTKFVKSTKDLFEFLLKVVVPTKKPGIYNCMTLTQLRLFIELLGNCSLLDLLISGLVSILTCLRSDINLSRPLFPKDIWPTTISSNFNTAIDTTHLDDLVLFAIDKAITQNPHNYNWLFVKADLAIAETDFFKAMRNYLEAGAAATEFFTKPITKDIYTDWVLQQMIRCCREMGFHHQAIFLCQYIPEINIAAQMATQVTISNDSSDLYIHLMWDINLIEILAAIEYERGAFSKHKRFLDSLSQPDLNSNNSSDVINGIQERKKLEFLRLISMQYVMR